MGVLQVRNFAASLGWELGITALVLALPGIWFVSMNP